MRSYHFLVAGPITSLAGQQSTDTIANKDKLSNQRQLSEYSICLQLGCPNMNVVKAHLDWLFQLKPHGSGAQLQVFLQFLLATIV